jgi:predicted dehydrogenase
MRALQRGRHLLIEKPITATLEEADEIVELAERTGAVVQTGHVERFNRAVRGAWGLIANPRYLESDRLAPFSPRGTDVAVVLDLMIHDIDLVLTLMGSDVDGISAIGVPVLTRSIDIANARLTFRSGAVANITASRVSRERMRKLRIFQESGYISLDLASGRGEFYRLRNDVDVETLVTAPQSLDAFVERVELEAPEVEPLKLEFESFLSAVRGDAPVAVSARAGREALALALRIEEAIQMGLGRSPGRPVR